MRHTPEFATYAGFPGHNDRWSDYSPAGIERRHALAREQLRDLLSIDRGRLTPAEQIHLDLFRRRLETQIEGFRLRFLHTDPRFFYDTPADLVEGYRAITSRADRELASLFGTRPRVSYRVLSIPAETARVKSTAYYEPGSATQGRPGTCFVNTYDLKARPKWEMEALALHECIPGHHLQVSIAQEIKGVPKVINYHDYTAFVEGWGLYAETLGHEMGFYRDLYFKFGQLTYEMWRAMRLVVDTGIHSQGWTTQQAIDYFRDNTAQDERAIEAEIHRYISNPGLALAYKIGELKIKELRASAQKELGPAFELRAFHDEVLRHGALPLDLLEQNVETWVAAEKAALNPDPGR